MTSRRRKKAPDSQDPVATPANLPHSQLFVREALRKCLRLLVEREGLEPSTPAL
jgi:hypothetical protein